MFIGHYALALGARKISPLPSLAMLFIAVQLLDLLWPIFVLTGLETVSVDPGNTVLTPLNFESYPYSHSLLMSVVWGIALGLIYGLVTGNKKGSLILGLLVISHWFLDLLTHRPDLPLTPFTDLKVGLGLWNYAFPEIILEFGLFLIGAYFYYKNAVNIRKGVYWSLITFFVIMHAINILGPPPPSADAVAWAGNLMWLFVAWAWWAEKKPKAKAEA